MLKLPHNFLIPHASKVILKILQVRLQQYMNRDLSDVLAGFRKGRGTRDQIANMHGIIEKQEISRDQLSHVQLFVTPWTAACQASLPITNSKSLLKLMSTKSVIRADLCSESCRDTTATKYLLLLYWLCQSLWLCGSQQTENFFKRWEYQTTWPASWEICLQVKKQQLELDMLELVRTS